jgi:hypothetical protein
MTGEPVAGHEVLTRHELEADPFDGYDFDVRNYESLEFEVPPRAEYQQLTADWTYFEQLHSDHVRYDEELELESSFEVPPRAVYERWIPDYAPEYGIDVVTMSDAFVRLHMPLNSSVAGDAHSGERDINDVVLGRDNMFYRHNNPPADGRCSIYAAGYHWALHRRNRCCLLGVCH